jgi:hypothetical protein
VLKVGKDHHLQNADDLSVGVGDQHVTSTPASFFDRSPVRIDVVLVLELGRERAALDNERGRRDVVELDGTKGELHV